MANPCRFDNNVGVSYRAIILSRALGSGPAACIGLVKTKYKQIMSGNRIQLEDNYPTLLIGPTPPT